MELGLEILARLRQREEYAKFLHEHGEIAKLSLPDFERLNRSVRIYASSVVWIQHPEATGSGFAIGPNEVATNRHVVISDKSKKLLPPRSGSLARMGFTAWNQFRFRKTDLTTWRSST